MNIGSKVYYRGESYWVISVTICGKLLEIAPTQHGAGSFYVTKDYLDKEAA